MRRFLAALSTCLVLAGCATTSGPSLPPGSNGGPVDAYADAADKVMDRAAASIVVAKEANAAGNRDATAAELSLAEAILPRPSPSAVTRARVRSKDLDPKEYERAAELADKAQRDLETLWGMVEKEKGLADADLAKHQADLDAKRDLLLTGLGGLIILASVAAFFWGTAVGISKPEAGLAFAIGSLVAVLPHIVANEYTGYAIGAAAVLGLAKLAQVLFLRRARCTAKTPSFQPLGPHEHPQAKAQEARPRD
jgi:hypothetical protein